MSTLRKLAEEAIGFHRRYGDVFPWAQFGDPLIQRDDFKKEAEELSKYNGVSISAGYREEYLSYARFVMTFAGWVQDGLNSYVLSDELVALLLTTEICPVEIKTPYRIQALQIPSGWFTARGKPATFLLGGSYTDNFWTATSCSVEASQLSMGWHFDALKTNEFWEETGIFVTARVLFNNFAVWMEHTRPKKESRSSGKKRNRKHKTPTIWNFVNRIKLHPEFVTAARKAAFTGNIERKKLELQHIVRGHTKNQPFGPGNSERKRIWVDPYWRGPETEEAWARQYEASTC